MVVAERESGGGDSEDQLDNKFILVQTVQTDIHDGPKERCPYSGFRRLNTTGYYMLDLRTGDVSTLPRTVQLQDEGRTSSMVALGSKIYIFGRRPLINDDEEDDDDDDEDDSTIKINMSFSYFLDLPDSQSTKPSPSPSCWKRALPFTTDDELPIGGVVEFAGKMYAFINSDDSCFCGVFDPSEPEPQWRRIKSTPTPTPAAANNKIDPTSGIGIDPPVLVDHKNNRIVVYIGNISSLFAYYPCEDRWECLVECFYPEGFRGWLSYPEPVTIVDGVIYIHRPELPCFFVAFDIATKQRLEVSVSCDADRPYEFYLPIRFYDSLLHLGKDVLCVLASIYKDPRELQITTLVHVVQFKVKLINNNGTKEVIVTPLPSRSRFYDLHSRCALYHCLAL